MTFDLRSDFTLVLAVTDGSHVIAVPDATPALRLYGESGAVGDLAVLPFAEGDITDVESNGAGGSRLTSAAHPFQVGDVLTVAGVGGSVGANGVKTVIAVATDTFDVASAPGGAYTAGGTAAVRGLYRAVADAGIRGGLEPGRAYTAVWRYALAASPAVVTQTFAGV